jgi:hypothetical protein
VFTLGKACLCRQILATPQVRLAQKKEVIDLPLFAPSRLSLVGVTLLPAQAFNGFALAASLLKDSVLLIAQLLYAQEFLLQCMPFLIKSCFVQKAKAQLGSGRSCVQLLRLLYTFFFDSILDLVDQVTHPSYLLVGSAQPQFLLAFYALTEMQDCFE